MVTSSNYSTDIIIRAMRAGAREFIPKPFIKDEFINSISKFKDQIIGLNSENKKCRVITTFSNKGGIGKTALATNLALELANMTKEKVALIDLNLQLGDITTFLDINPSFDISYVIQNLTRIDETFLLSTLEKYKDSNLYILADPPYLEQAEDITAEQISTLFSVLKQAFSYIVVDASANFDGKTITALDHSDLILLVTIVNLPAIRNCQRCLDLFERLGYEKEKTKIILSRYMENDEIKIEDVEDVLGRKIYWKVPNNYFTIMSAINKGIPVGLVNADSNISQSYRELAAMLSDNIYKQDFGKKVSRKSFFNLANLFK
ncbi:MAG: AAA family ATPase [bacterium]